MCCLYYRDHLLLSHISPTEEISIAYLQEKNQGQKLNCDLSCTETRSILALKNTIMITKDVLDFCCSENSMPCECSGRVDCLNELRVHFFKSLSPSQHKSDCNFLCLPHRSYSGATHQESYGPYSSMLRLLHDHTFETAGAASFLWL